MDRDHPSSEHIEDTSGRQYHIGLAPDEVAEFIMLVGDSVRAAICAKMMDIVEHERRQRDFLLNSCYCFDDLRSSNPLFSRVVRDIVMDIVSEYLLFLAKGLTLFALILVTVAGIVAILSRAKHEGREIIQIKNLNQQYERLKNSMKAAMHTKKSLRNLLKKHDKAPKEPSDKASVEQQPRRRIFVLNFHGDIVASGVASLREEVTAILSVAEPQDEVVVRLESSGGVVHAYGLAASQLVRIKERGIPLTITVDKVAASGGYMMACVADLLIAAPFAVIGSIGVVSQIPNFNRLLKNHDVDFEQFTAGEYKRTVTLFGETTEAGRAKLQEEVETTHALFKTFLKTHREALDIEAVANGEHWFGTEARELKLVDELRTSDDYLLSASAMADLYEVTYLAKKKHWLAQLVGRLASR